MLLTRRKWLSLNGPPILLKYLIFSFVYLSYSTTYRNNHVRCELNSGIESSYSDRWEFISSYGDVNLIAWYHYVTLQVSASLKLARATKLPCLTAALQSHLLTSACKSQSTILLFIGTKKENTGTQTHFCSCFHNFFLLLMDQVIARPGTFYLKTIFISLNIWINQITGIQGHLI